MFCVSSYMPDLRDDKQFFIDHPGAVPITTAQVNRIFLWNVSIYLACYLNEPF